MIESLDMNILLGGGAKKPQKKQNPGANPKTDFSLYEEPRAQVKTAPKDMIIGGDASEDDFGKAFTEAFNEEIHKNDNYVPLKQYEKETEKDSSDDGRYNDYVTLKQTGGKIVTPSQSYGSRGERYANQDEEFLQRYNAANDYLMSGGKNAFESTVKGAVNRARSAVGTGVEDFAYFLYDNAPGYNPAKVVLDKRTASTISEMADSQFEDAKANTGEIGDRLIDFADGSSEMLGYSMFGPKALTYAFGTREGFGEYRTLREQGYSEMEAFAGALGKAGYVMATEKVDDFIGKNNPIDDYLSANYNVYRKLDSGNVKKYNDIRLSNQEYARVASAVGTYHPNKKGYVEIILDNENGDPAIRYYVFVNDDSTITILGKEGTKNIHEGAREYYEGK